MFGNGTTSATPSKTGFQIKGDLSLDLKLDYNTRHDNRVRLLIDLYLRRSINSVEYGRKVRTINVSRHGACIISDVKLVAGTQLEVTAFNGRFSSMATVCHCRRTR